MNKRTDIQQPKGFVRKFDLAFKYFPNATSKKLATDSLTRAINRCQDLCHALANAPGGYKVTGKYYTPHQVELIYYYLGEP